MDTTETNPEEKDQTPQKLGDLLKSYREAANMDIAQAADTLCLAEGTLHSLENEDFEKLPEAPYLRGYLRGYAKLANVNSSEVIALYESMRGGSSIASDTQYNFSPSSSVDDYNKPLVPPYLVQLGTVAVIFLVFSIIYMIPGVKEWTVNIWDEFSKQNVVAEHHETSTPKPIEQASLNVPNRESTELSVKIASNTAEQASKSPEATTSTEASIPDTASADNAIKMEGTITRQDADTNNDTSPEGADTNTTNTQAKNTEQSDSTTTTDTDDNDTVTNSGSETEDSTTSVDPDAQAQESIVANETTPVDLTSVDTTSGEVMVKLVFKDEVWMSIKNKSKKVFSGLKKSGDTEEFKTQKPLSFKVGNAPGVDIYINGKLYNQTPHVKGVVAKFKVENI